MSYITDTQLDDVRILVRNLYQNIY